METVPLVATCARGIERALKHELSSLGVTRSQAGRGAVLFEAPLSVIAELNVQSRVASRVLWVLKRLEARTPEVLCGELAALKFERYVGEETTFAVEAHLRNVPWDHTLYAAQRIKDVVVDRLRMRGKPRPRVDPKRPRVRFVLHWDTGEATLALDTTGEPLHRRGYRKDGGPAPIRETLAAAVLAIGHADACRPFLDPCCGSGTLGVEQAWRALRRAPGRDRRFAFEAWRFAPPELKEALARARERARDEERARPKAPIRLSDLDEAQLERTRAAVRAAGVEHAVEVRRADAREIAIEGERPQVVSNLPFGQRLGKDDAKALAALYEGLGARIARATDVRALLLSSHPKAEALLGLGKAKRWALYNGPLKTILHRWDL